MGEKAKALASSMRTSGPLFTRFLAGFDESNRTRQAPSLPNHASWTLGHLALTMHKFAERFDGQGLPASDFLTGDGHKGDAKRYDTESVSLGSKPTDTPSIYPTLERGRAVFESALDRLASALATLDDARLSEVQPWGKGEMRGEELATRIMFHNGIHAGQMTDLRRALGMPGVIG